MSLRAAVKKIAPAWLRPKHSGAATEPPQSDKAAPEDFLGRFREIVSDPLNLLIERVPQAGMLENGTVCLHNGLRVSIEGPHAYYGRFSEILVINRGVHEPVEEYVFQEVMHRMPEEPVMLELGAYWGHYSMWLKSVRPRSQVFLVEPESQNLAAGRANFARHNYSGTFIQSFVGRQQFEVDNFLREQGYPRLHILHSDIQGFESEMLEGATESFKRELVDYAFVSTHSQSLHDGVVAKLSEMGMRVEVSSGFDFETTSYDGFVFASRTALAPVFAGFSPVGRHDIANSKPGKLVSYLSARL